MDPNAILITTTGVLMFLTLIGVSFKTGFVAYSIWSLTRRNQAKFKIVKSRLNKFVGVISITLCLNVAYNLAILRDLSQIGAILLLSIFNTVILGWGLSFWILLERIKK